MRRALLFAVMIEPYFDNFSSSYNASVITVFELSYQRLHDSDSSKFSIEQGFITILNRQVIVSVKAFDTTTLGGGLVL